MNKEILIAVDDSIHSKQAIKYVTSLYSSIKNLSFKLFHIQPTISQYLMDEAQRNAESFRKLKTLQKKQTEKAETILNTYKKYMTDTGIEESHIKTLTRRKDTGIAKDILELAMAGNYDAVVVGRKGSSKIQEMIFGSVTRKLLDHSEVVPVWVTDDNIDTSNILIAVDGSEGSLRAVDHVSFMFSGNKQVQISLLHAIPHFGTYNPIEFEESDQELKDIIVQTETKKIERFFDHALKTFREAGIDKEQLRIKTAECGMNIGKTLLEEIRKGDFSTVVVGRNGSHNSFFFGSISRYLIDKTINRTIWLVP